VNEADVLIHVVDATHPNFDMQMRAVEEVLTQIKAHEKVTLTVFNKVDELSPENTAMLRQHLQQTPKSVALSALTGQGVDELLFELERIFSSWRKTMRLKIPQSQAALIAELHRDGQVLERTYEEDFVILEVQVPSHMQGKLKEYHANPRNARQRKTTRKTVENGG
jgi:GTP-binding protein HflX